MATTDFTDGVTLSAAAWATDVDTATYSYLTGVAGTNTITATGPTGIAAYAATQRFRFIPANTNTGATTINVTPSGDSALGAKSIFWNGAACVGGEIRQSVPVEVMYDGTQFHIIANGFNAPFLDTHPVVQGSADSTKKMRFEADGITTATTRVLTLVDANLTLTAPVLGTEAASTSGTTVDFTGIPSWATKIIIQFVGVSTNGSSSLLIQIGHSGGIENSGYLGSSVQADAGGNSAANATAGFGIVQSNAASVQHGSVMLTLEDSTQFTWVASGVLGRSDAAIVTLVAGSKSLSAALDRVRVTTSNGTDAFDAGAINILYS